MTVAEQIHAFGLDMDARIDRFIEEFDIPAAAMIGVLDIVKFRLIDRLMWEDLDDDDDDETEYNSTKG